MIRLKELAEAQSDIFTQHGEWGDEEFDVIRHSGLDPVDCIQFARFKAEGYEEQVVRLVAEGIDMNVAIRNVVAAALCDGIAVGVRAGRNEQLAKEHAE